MKLEEYYIIMMGEKLFLRTFVMNRVKEKEIERCET